MWWFGWDCLTTQNFSVLALALYIYLYIATGHEMGKTMLCRDFAYISHIAVQWQWSTNCSIIVLSMMSIMPKCLIIRGVNTDLFLSSWAVYQSIKLISHLRARCPHGLSRKLIQAKISHKIQIALYYCVAAAVNNNHNNDMIAEASE